MQSPAADVAIIGLGPVGATLAGLLGKYGLRVVVVEKEEAVFPLPRAAHIDHTGLRTLQEIGCLNELLPKMIRNKGLSLLNSERRVLARISADQESISGLPTSVYFYQPEFDTALRNAAAARPNVDVRLQTEMVSLDVGVNGVTIHTRGRSGKSSAFRASWVVGCDGAWSPVREAMGIKLKSFNFDEMWLVLDLQVDVSKTTLPADHVVEVCDPARPYLSTPISHNRQRFEFMLLPDDDPEQMKQEHVIAELLQAWLPPGSYGIERSAIYTFHGLVAERWRYGRVLIAGDAAHQTPPFLGQGMCAGIRDASNLAWKLARVINCGAPEELLDTYESERSPHAVKIIEAAIRIGKVICQLDPEKAAERDHFLLAGEAGAREELAFALPRLERGPLVLDGGGALFVQPTVNGIRLDDLVGSRFLVIGRSAESLGRSAEWWEKDIDARVALLSDLDNPTLGLWLDRYQSDVVVVRPDRYVLGAAKNLDDVTASVIGLLTAVSPSAENYQPAAPAYGMQQ